MNDLTIIYYTSNKVSEFFISNTIKYLRIAAGDIPIISVSKEPMDLGINLCIGDIGQNVLNIYKQILIGAKAAKTKYVAMAEDDVLYSKEHFEYRPSPGKFAYNMNRWGIFTWVEPPIFSRRNRMTMLAMICERELLIEALEERFMKYQDESKIKMKYWAEPGRYERGLQVTIRETEQFESKIPIIYFSHPSSTSFIDWQGTRKSLGKEQTYNLEGWGTAEDIRRLHE
jgi:hypothetical protein